MKLILVLTALVGIAVAQRPDLGREIHEVVAIILQQDPNISVPNCVVKCDIIFDQEQEPTRDMCEHECVCAIEGIECPSPPPQPTGQTRPPRPTPPRPTPPEP